MLFYIGTGPVRGFAVTLGIGIITTVFTAFNVTRLIVAIWFMLAAPQNRADLTRPAVFQRDQSAPSPHRS